MLVFVCFYKAMHENEVEFPGADVKHSRKPSTMFTQFQRSFGKKVEDTDREKAKPYEHKQYIIECEQRMGWTTEEAQEQWNLMDADPDILEDRSAK